MVRLESLALEHFRNVTAGELRANGGDVFLLGPNAQGKTNWLEAVGLIGALRSFRTRDLAVLRQHGQPQARLFYRLCVENVAPGILGRATTGQSELPCPEVEPTTLPAPMAPTETHPPEGPTFRPTGNNPAREPASAVGSDWRRVEVLVTLGGATKRVEVDGVTVGRLGDFLGSFPTVHLSSGDVALVREGPAERRRWLDLVLSGRDAAYFRALTDYHRALRDRNRLLREHQPTASVAAFEVPLAEAGVQLIARRAAALEELASRMAGHYANLAAGRDAPMLTYRPSRCWPGLTEAREALAEQRFRDAAAGTTTGGPHRDDFTLTFGGQPAREVGSEGQQRSLVLALKLAEVDWLAQPGAPRPILLADDVLGELDSFRTAAFWRALPEHIQVIATGTRPPLGQARQWAVWHLKAGQPTPNPPI